MRLPGLLLAALLALALPRAAPAQPFDFVAFGDMPYCSPREPEACPGEVARVEALIAEINAARPAFSIFLGDTKGGGEPCTEAIVFDRTLAWMGQVEGALVYTPGDNEWTDCWQARAGGHDPLALLAGIRERFFPGPWSLGRAPIPLSRQADVMPEYRLYVENARWERNGVLFLTVHVPGSNNNLPLEGGPARPEAAAEYMARNRANLAWIAEGFALAAREGHRAVVVAMQADLYYRDRCGRGWVEGYLDTRRALAEGARRLGRPVLLLQGDSHSWWRDRPEPDLPNLTRIVVPGDGDTRAVLVAVDPEAAEPFRFHLIGPADRPAPPPC
jgi:hypothetical protein